MMSCSLDDRSRISRASVLRRGLGLAGAALLAACGAPVTSGGVPTSAPAPTAQSNPTTAPAAQSSPTAAPATPPTATAARAPAPPTGAATKPAAGATLPGPDARGTP